MVTDIAFLALQLAYLGGCLVTLWLLTRRVNLIDRSTAADNGERPDIILFYPVLRELEETMRTTFLGMSRAPYPGGNVRIIAIPNADDTTTLDALERLRMEFDFLEILAVPPTTDPSWNVVWDQWDSHPQAYWWHDGRRAGVRDLPPKKTRQLIWAMYQVAPGNEDALLSYIDADSVIPTDYWVNAAAGIQHYDVVQNTNITGNLLDTVPSAFHGFDHIAWDATIYRHMTDDGRHPFYVLGKGLFFRIGDLLDAGGFHPWLTIEDPEIGMRLWSRGKRLGVVESPLIEEVPSTYWGGVTQRKRWVAGFFQSLGSPLRQMGMSRGQRWRARLNFVPCLSLAVNPLGIAFGAWVLINELGGHDKVPNVVAALGALNSLLAVGIIAYFMVRAWKLTAPVLTRTQRVKYLLLVNPLFLLVYWMLWLIPLVKGFVMWLADGGLVWERTEKRDANHQLVRAAPAEAVAASPSTASESVVA